MKNRMIKINGTTDYNPQVDSTQWYRFTIDDNDKIIEVEVEYYNQGGRVWRKGDSEEKFIKVMGNVLKFNEVDTLDMLSKLVKE